MIGKVHGKLLGNSMRLYSYKRRMRRGCVSNKYNLIKKIKYVVVVYTLCVIHIKTYIHIILIMTSIMNRLTIHTRN